jgi:hypothetical protein
MRFRYWLYLIVGVLAVLALGAMAASAMDILGDLPVSAPVTFSNDNINVYGNVLISSGGTLTLTNIDLTIMCSSDGQYKISVSQGGKLVFNGGSIKSGDPANHYKFEIRGSATLEGLTIRDTWGSGSAFDASTGNDPDLSGLVGGVQIYSSSVYIGNCTLEKGALTMVYVSNSATPTIFGCTVRDVIYDVEIYSQVTTNPSSTKWSAMAFGIVLDGAAAKVDSCVFADIGTFSTMAGIYYRNTATNNNDYRTIAAAIAAKGTVLNAESNSITRMGVLTKTSDTFVDNGNTVNQAFYQYRVAGIYGYHSTGSAIRGNTVDTSVWGIYVNVDTSGAGNPMVFDVIIDNVLQRNSLGGAFFGLKAVKRQATINISDNDINTNGVAPTTLYDDSGVYISASDCTADIRVILQANNIKNNIGRGVMIDVRTHTGALTVEATNTNVIQRNGGAGLRVNADTVSGNVKVEATNLTLTSNNPTATGDMGALSVEGGALKAAFTVKMADVVSTINTGRGAAVAIGAGMSSANQATRTTYTVHNSQFSDNTVDGLYIFDSYGTSGQQTTFEWANVEASRNLEHGIYVHSWATLGNVKFTATDVTADENLGGLSGAIRIEMRATGFAPRSLFRNLNIRWAAEQPNTRGLWLQGPDAINRWGLDIVDSVLVRAEAALDAEFCNVKATNCNLTGMGVNTVLARDSRVDLYDSRMPELSAQVTGTSVNCGVFFYRWFNITKVSWQNGQPIKNQTITIKRYREPQDDVFTAATNAKGKLADKQIPYWVKDDMNNPLRNDELQAFMKLHNDDLNSLSFNFNVTVFGIEDPRVPELIISTPGNKTIQKLGNLVIIGEIRDAHSGIMRVEATLDNIVWYNATGLENKEGRQSATFQILINGLTDNTYRIKVRGWDVARYANESMGVALVEIVDVRIDTQPPFLQIENPPTEHFVTNEKNITIVGRTEPNVNIRRLTVNDVPVDIAGITFEYPTELEEGSNTFIIIVEDTAGNIAVATRQIVRDTLAPTLIVTTPTEGFSSREQAFEISGDSEQTATVYVKLDARTEELVSNRGGTRFYHVITITKEGSHTITVRAEDAAHNVNSRSIHVKYDITPPFIEVEAPTRNLITNVQTMYVAGSTDTEVRQIIVNGLYFPVINGLFALEINLLEGNQTLKVEVADAAGNTNSTSIPLKIDVTPPLIMGLTWQSSEPGSSPVPIEDNMVINKRSVRFSGRLQVQDQRGLWIRVSNDNRTALWDEGGVFYRDFNLDEQENTVTFFAVDIAGNRETLVFTLNVDTRPPTVRYFSPKMSPNLEATVEEDTVVISGVVEEEGVTLLINSRPIPVVPRSGTFQTTVPLFPGGNNIEIVYNDKAGNSGSDVLKINYEKKGTTKNGARTALANLWWVFAIAIAIAIILPLMVRRTRQKWMKEHPELEKFEQSGGRLDEDYDDGYGPRRGGGYR